MAAATPSPDVECIYHKETGTCTYIVSDPASKEAMIVDPVLDFRAADGRISTEHNDAVLERVRDLGVSVKFIVETHVHADHMTGASFLRDKLPGTVRTAIGEHVVKVQSLFAKVFNLSEGELKPDGSAFDVLLREGEDSGLAVGAMPVRVLHTPGHTPACVTLVVGDAAFTGDAMFMPDFGTGRCDFPEGSATQLFESAAKIFALPPETRVFVGHDYGPGGRDIRWETTVGECKAANKHVKDGTTKEDFVSMREARDKTLSPPKQLLTSLQVNLRNGKLPSPESDGKSYLKIPITEASSS